MNFLREGQLVTSENEKASTGTGRGRTTGASYEEECEFPYKKMEEVTGMNSSTIRRGIISLVDGGFLSYDHGGLERNPNLYNLNDVWL